MHKKRHNLVKYFLLCAMLIWGQAVVAESMFIPKPSAGLLIDAGKGKLLFQKNCVSCHGADLKGTRKGPPMLHRVYEPSHHSDIAFQLAVRNGVMQHHWQFGKMPPIPDLTPDDVAHMIAYIRAEQHKAGIK